MRKFYIIYFIIISLFSYSLEINYLYYSNISNLYVVKSFINYKTGEYKLFYYDGSIQKGNINTGKYIVEHQNKVKISIDSMNNKYIVEKDNINYTINYIDGALEILNNTTGEFSIYKNGGILSKGIYSEEGLKIFYEN